MGDEVPSDGEYVVLVWRGKPRVRVGYRTRGANPGWEQLRPGTAERVGLKVANRYPNCALAHLAARQVAVRLGRPVAVAYYPEGAPCPDCGDVGCR